MALTPAKFEYIRPGTLEDAVEILHDNEGSAKLLGGGQSLIPLLKARIISFEKLVDIGNLKELNFINRVNGTLSLGSATRVGQLEFSQEIANNFGMLHEASLQIADPLIRNMGTVGGNVSHADPGNDLPPVMVASDSTFILRGKNGTREVKADGFFMGPFETSAEEGEILSELRIPACKSGEGDAFVKIRKMSGDFSVASSAAKITVSEDQKISSARVVVSSASPMPERIKAIEELLIDSRVDESTLKEIRQRVLNEVEIMDDPAVPEKYRKFAITSSVTKAIETAYRRAVER